MKTNTKMQKIIDRLRAPLQGAIDGLGSANKESFCFFVPAIDVKLLHSVLPLQMRHHRFDLVSLMESVLV